MLLSRFLWKPFQKVLKDIGGRSTFLEYIKKKLFGFFCKSIESPESVEKAAGGVYSVCGNKYLQRDC